MVFGGKFKFYLFFIVVVLNISVKVFGVVMVGCVDFFVFSDDGFCI